MLKWIILTYSCIKNRTKMHYLFLRSFILYTIGICVLLCSCQEKSKSKSTLFQKVEASHTHINFSNDLSYDAQFNIYTYRNFYNGGGVAIGDINNDSLPD